MVCLTLFASLALATFAIAAPRTFSFTLGPLQQCVDLNGGSGPYSLVMVPWATRADVYRFDIPSSVSSVQNFYTFRHGSWSEGQLYVATMSDGTGWGRGGVTDVMTVGKGNDLCDHSAIQHTDGVIVPSRPKTIFECDRLAFRLLQLRTSRLSATLYGFIPNRDTLEIMTVDPPAVFYDWTCNVPAGPNGTEFVVTALTSGTFGNMGTLPPLLVHPNPQNNSCLSGVSTGPISQSGQAEGGKGASSTSEFAASTGSSSATSASALAGRGAASGDPLFSATSTSVLAGSSAASGDPLRSGQNGDPPGGHDSGTGGGKGGHESSGNTPTIVGAVLGSVLGASIALVAFLWWLLRHRRARTDYAVDLLDATEEPDPSTATAVVTPLTPFHHDSRQSTSNANEKGRPHPSEPSAKGSNSAYEGAATGNTSASVNSTQAAEIEPAIDAEAPLRKTGAQPPPTYAHVLWVTGTDDEHPLPPLPEAEPAKPT